MKRVKKEQNIEQKPKKYVRVDGNKSIIFYIYDKEWSGCWIPSQCFCDPYTRNASNGREQESQQFRPNTSHCVRNNRNRT